MSELEKRLNDLRDIGFANKEQIRSQCLSIIDLIDGQDDDDEEDLDDDDSCPGEEFPIEFI